MEARRRERGPWVPKPGTWGLRHLPSPPVLRSGGSGVVTCSFLPRNRVSLPAAIRRFTRFTANI